MIARIRKTLLAWRLAAVAALYMAFSACAVNPAPIPDAVKVMVPVPVACEIEQVPTPDYPAKQARPGMDIWSLTKIATADRRTRMAENGRLRAANNNPCPGEQK